MITIVVAYLRSGILVCRLKGSLKSLGMQMCSSLLILKHTQSLSVVVGKPTNSIHIIMTLAWPVWHNGRAFARDPKVAGLNLCWSAAR